MPIFQNFLKPEIVDVCNDLRARQSRQKLYFDRNARPLLALKKGDKVRYKVHNRWNDGVICNATVEPRSYFVRNANGCVRRNRRHLHKMPQSYSYSTRYDFDQMFENAFNPSPVHNTKDTSQQRRNRNVDVPQNQSQRMSSFGRVIRPPQRYGYSS